MSPVIVEGMLWRRAPEMPLGIIIGAAGGIRIFSAVFQLLFNMIDRKKPAKEAILFPRFHDDLSSSEIENTYGIKLIEDLQKNHKHQLRILDFFRYDKTSFAGTIVISKSDIEAESDPRARNDFPVPVIMPWPSQGIAIRRN